MDPMSPRSSVDSAMASDRNGPLLLLSPDGGQYSHFHFTLSGNALTYAQSSSSPPVGSIGLEGAAVDIVAEDKYQRPFVFEINCPSAGRVYVLVANNSMELQEWLNAIRRAMLRIRRDKAKLAAQSRRMNREEAAANNPAAASFAQQTTDNGSVGHTTNGSGFYASPARPVSNGDASHRGTPGETRDKYDVYRQWLEETREQKKGARGGRGRDMSPEYGNDSSQPWYKNCCTIV